MVFALLLTALMAPFAAMAAPACSDASGRFIQENLAAGRHHTRNWANSWGALWAMTTVGQAVGAVAYQDPALRKDLWVGAASSSLGLIPTWIIPPRIIADGAEAEEDPCPTLEHMQMLLARDAENDDANTGLLSHAANLGVNLGIAAILGAGFGHWGAAEISLGVGVFMGEMMILTYPRSATRTDASPRLAIAPIVKGAVVAASVPF
jgi:hypothetical protein